MGSVSPFGVDTFQSGYHTKNEKKNKTQSSTSDINNLLSHHDIIWRKLLWSSGDQYFVKGTFLGIGQCDCVWKRMKIALNCCVIWCIVNIKCILKANLKTKGISLVYAFISVLLLMFFKLSSTVVAVLILMIPQNDFNDSPKLKPS